MNQSTTVAKSGITSFRPATRVALATGLFLLSVFSLYSPAAPALGYHMMVSAAAGSQTGSLHRIQPVSHIVRRGDTVYNIAKRYHVSVAQLRVWNKRLRRSNYIAPGQPLRLYLEVKQQASKKPIQPVTHIVHRGDTLHNIAKRYHVEITQLRVWNKRLRRSNYIAPGQPLHLFVQEKQQAIKKYRRNQVKGSTLKDYLNPIKLHLRSQSAAIVDLKDDVILYRKKMNKRRPIASLTKLMTAMVILDSRLNLNKRIQITSADKDWIRNSGSRLRVGTVLRRKDLLHIALAASENRASHALARTYPGGKRAFIRAMNRKARSLKMKRTRFADSSGLSSGNISTAIDLVRMVRAASNYPVIRRMTTSKRGWVRNQSTGRKIRFHNTNRLVRRGHWDINVSKTGFINEAGYCMVMQAIINHRPVLIVLLKSARNRGKYNDAKQIKQWVKLAVQKQR